MAEAIDWALQPGSIAPEVQAQLAEHLPGPDGVSVTDMVWNVTKVRRLVFVCIAGLRMWGVTRMRFGPGYFVKCGASPGRGFSLLLS